MKKLVFFILFAFANLALAKPSYVLSYHKQATEIGKEILDNGGNAFDAFIATTAAQYILTEGITTAAGPLNALLYDKKSNKILYLDGGWNNPADPLSQWTPENPSDGKEILVPGALRALELLSKNFGELNFKNCLTPAVGLARDGFTVSELLHKSISQNQAKLKATTYGRSTFFLSGKPLDPGDKIRLPIIADFLEKIQEEGADYMYQGDWAKKLVKFARNRGGKLSLKDLSQYKAVFREPRVIHLNGYKIYGNSGRSFGGISTLLALKALESWTPLSSTHYSNSASDLTTLIRVLQQVHKEPWLYDYEKLDSASFVQEKLSRENASKIWNEVQNPVSWPDPTEPRGNHSYQVTVSDAEGNMIIGINTINARPWGKGFFVDGVPLSDAGSLVNSIFYGELGGRRVDPLSMHIITKNEEIKMVSGSFGAGLIQAEYQFLVNFLVYGFSASEITGVPRFGARVLRGRGGTYYRSHDFSTSVLNALKSNGIELVLKKSNSDIGLGIVMTHQDGVVQTAKVPIR